MADKATATVEKQEGTAPKPGGLTVPPELYSPAAAKSAVRPESPATGALDMKTGQVVPSETPATDAAKNYPFRNDQQRGQFNDLVDQLTKAPTPEARAKLLAGAITSGEDYQREVGENRGYVDQTTKQDINGLSVDMVKLADQAAAEREKAQAGGGIFAGIEAGKPADAPPEKAPVKPEGENGTYSDKQIEDLFEKGQKLQMAKGYYEVKAEKVDPSKYKDGIVASSTDSSMKLETPMTVQTTGGKTVTLPKGTELPSGFELKPQSMQDNPDKSRTVTGADLAVKSPDGKMSIKLADGSTVEVGNQHINGDVTVSGGAKVRPGGYTIDRDAVDANGKKIVDAYFNKDDADFQKRWEPVPGKPGVFSPTESQMGQGRTLVQIPENWEPGKMTPNYSGYRDSPVNVKPGDFVLLERLPDGKVNEMYRVEQAAAVGTYVGTDPAGKAALAGSAEKMSELGGNVVAAAHSREEFQGRDGAPAAPVVSAGVENSRPTEERALAQIEAGHQLTDQQKEDFRSAMDVLQKATPEQRADILEQARRAAEEVREGKRAPGDARGLTALAYLGPDVINAIAGAFGL